MATHGDYGAGVRTRHPHPPSDRSRTVLTDLSLDELEAYRPELPEPEGFRAFWNTQLEAARTYPLEVQRSAVRTRLRTVEVHDLRFPGYGGSPVAAWLLLPTHRDGPLPTVVEFASYGGGRGLPHDRLVWSAAGYAHLVMDTRGQGSSSHVGSTADPDDPGSPAAPGYLTRGIGAPATAYYTRLFVDAARAVDAARTHPRVDPERIAVAGISQGGGLALAAAHLAERPAAVLAGVPFLAHFRRALEITDEQPYAELTEYCRTHRDEVDAVLTTLSYLDVVNHAKRATAPALISVGLADAVCPPSTVFAAHHHYGATSRLSVYPYDGHDGGGVHHDRERLGFLAQHLG